MAMQVFTEVAADEVRRSFPNTPLCQASVELADAELAELIRLPWRRGRFRLDLGPEPILQCSHEHEHPGQHVAFSAESGDATLWVAWDGQHSRVFAADYCRRESGSGHLCVLPDGHSGRHVID